MVISQICCFAFAFSRHDYPTSAHGVVNIYLYRCFWGIRSMTLGLLDILDGLQDLPTASYNSGIPTIKKGICDCNKVALQDSQRNKTNKVCQILTQERTLNPFMSISFTRPQSSLEDIQHSICEKQLKHKRQQSSPLYLPDSLNPTKDSSRGKVSKRKEKKCNTF